MSRYASLCLAVASAKLDGTQSIHVKTTPPALQEDIGAVLRLLLDPNAGSAAEERSRIHSEHIAGALHLVSYITSSSDC